MTLRSTLLSGNDHIDHDLNGDFMQHLLLFRRFATWLGAICAAPALIASALAAAPTLKLPDTVIPRSYQADLTLDPARKDFSGVITIDLHVRQRVQEVWMHARKIQVQSAVLVSGRKRYIARATQSGEDYLQLSFDTALPTGPARLKLRYTGVIIDGGSTGIFHTADEGADYLFTQFESIDARLAFPCFDEPGYKTPWQLTLRVPAGDKALSNTPAVRDVVSGKQRVVVFAPTKPLPSYLIAFAVGPFDIVNAGAVGRNGSPVRIVTPKGKASEARYAAEVAATLLKQLEDYFGIPYPYPKADQVAIPNLFGFGAMENAGFVTFAQTLLLAKPASDSIQRQRSYARLASHELAHQWFGNYVTTAWWDDIWLNEAFATWLQQSMTAAWKPEWNSRMDDVNSRLDVMVQDSLVSARKIRQEIQSPDDIANAFDDITYQKGAAVIGMFEHYKGAAGFRSGVQNYMKKHAFGNATAADFLAAQDGQGDKPITEGFNSFLNQPGVPLLSVKLNCSANGASVHLAQQRLLPIGSSGSTAKTWRFPVCLRYPSGESTRSECFLLSEAIADQPLSGEGGSCPAWIQADDQALGYYVTHYSPALLASLTGGDVKQRLPAPERLKLLGDAKLLADSGELPANAALQLLEALHGDEERHVVARSLDLALAYQENLVPENLIPNYQRFLLKNFQARARALGWMPVAGESDDAKLLRRRLIQAVANYGGDELLAETGRALADQWLAGIVDVDPDMLQSVLATGAHYGDKALALRYLARFKATQDRQIRQKIIRAMEAFRDPAALTAGYDAVRSGEVPATEGIYLLFAGQKFAATRQLPFTYLQAHWDEILAKRPTGGGYDLAAYFPQTGESFCDTASRDQLQAFFADRAPQFAGGPRNLAQVLETIDLCIARKETQGSAIATYLRAY
jgi:alanyl aminopeptidase